MNMTMTKSQKLWLKKMGEKGRLSAMFDKPPLRVMNNLAQMGFCQNIMDTFFEITEEGKDWCDKQEAS